jgi:DNA polymerase-3 subunit gamma/tau
MVLLRLLAFKPQASAQGSEQGTAEKKTLKTVETPRPPTPAPLAPSALGEQWFEVVQNLVKAQLIQAMTKELAMQTQLISQDASTWVLQCERDSLNNPNNCERLQLALQALGHAVQISVQSGAVQDTPAKRITTRNQERQAAAEAEIMNDPYVQHLIKEFDATIVPGSIKPLSH